MLTKEDIKTIKGLLDEALMPLKTDVSSLKTDVSSLKTDVSSLKTDVSSLKIDVSSLKIDTATLKDDLNSFKKETKKELAIIKNQMKKQHAELIQKSNIIIKFVEEEDSKTIRRVERIESHLHLSPL